MTRVLAVAQFRLRYLDSALSYLWALAGPMLFFAILWTMFTHIGGFNKGVPHYAYYLLMAFMLWTFFATATSNAVSSLVSNGDLLRKVPLPRAAIPLSVVLMGLLEVSINLVAVLLLLMLGGITPRMSWLELPALVVAIAVFATGMALLLSALYVRYRDVDQIWILGRQALFYGSAIFYVITYLPLSTRRVLILGPLAAIFTQARHAMIDPSAPSAVNAVGGASWLLIPAGVIAATVALGTWIFARESAHAAENL